MIAPAEDVDDGLPLVAQDEGNRPLVRHAFVEHHREQPGGEVLVTDSVYAPTRRFCDRMLARLGVTTRYYDPGIGAGIAPTWEAMTAGRGAVTTIDAFDPSGFACRLGSQVRNFSVRDFVPKSYRKATKVMAADIEMAVAAADLAARDAGISTAGTDPDGAARPDFSPTYPQARVGCHIGAGLIAAEINELSGALNEARNEKGDFDIHKWGSVGINNLTPLWLLKYLPNMLACHVTIIHDCQGPSNTITCAEASALLSIGESLRVIERGAADLCFCGGAEDKINPMALLRQQFTGRLNSKDNDRPASAVRPFDRSAAGTVTGQGGAIVMLEALETFEKRRASATGAAITPVSSSHSISLDRIPSSWRLSGARGSS